MADDTLEENVPESSSQTGNHRESLNLRNLVMDSPPPQTKSDQECLGVPQSAQYQYNLILIQERFEEFTSSPRLAQSRLLTYRLRPSSMTSRPNSFSNFPGFNLVGSSFPNGQPPF